MLVSAAWRSIGQGDGKFGRRDSDPFREGMGLVLIRKGMSTLGGRGGGPSSSTASWTWFLTWSVTAPFCASLRNVVWLGEVRIASGLAAGVVEAGQRWTLQ